MTTTITTLALMKLIYCLCLLQTTPAEEKSTESSWLETTDHKQEIQPLKIPPSQKETKLRKSNSKITLPGKKAIKALQEIELMMISLRKIEDYYFYREVDFPGQDPAVRDHEVSRFIRENNFIKRLCTVRSIMSEQFDDTLGKDNMDDTERAMEHLVFWEKPGDRFGSYGADNQCSLGSKIQSTTRTSSPLKVT